MIYHNSSQSYARPGINIGIRQHLVKRSARDLFRGDIFWRTLGKIGATACGVTFIITLIFGLYSSHLDKVTAQVTTYQDDLTDGNITLRAKRAGLLAPNAIEDAAGKGLSLYAPKKNQYFVFTGYKGRFDKL